VQRGLAGAAAVVFGLTLAAIIALALITPHITRAQFQRNGALLILGVFPTPGLAISLLLVVALLTVTAIRRSRAQA
jgi:hypothetical protein